MRGAAEITVLIATYNRADLLARTLDTLACSECARPWEVVVVDNNSSDHTREIVGRRVSAYPVPLRYVFESRQGKSIALNRGIAETRAPLVAFTDDDVRVPPAWLESITAPLFSRADVDYTGGPVRPLWGGAKPDWLDESGNPGGTI